MRIVTICAAIIATNIVPATASAQLIATSIPKVESAPSGSAAPAPEKKFALHLMASPTSKWKYNELAGGAVEGLEDIFDVGIFSGSPNSDFLLAGEAVVKAGRNFSFGFGGWHNKVGKVSYKFDVNTVDDSFAFIDRATGTLDGNLRLSEGHANVFYKNVGVQAGLVHTNSKLRASRILSSQNFPGTVGLPLQSIEEDNTANDWDLYGVYKYAGRAARPFGVSVGAGIYDKKGTTESTQRAADDQTIFSCFATGSVDIYKGFGIDVSYWYIGTTKATFGSGPAVISDAASRFTIGVGYSFSR